MTNKTILLILFLIAISVSLSGCSSSDEYTDMEKAAYKASQSFTNDKIPNPEKAEYEDISSSYVDVEFRGNIYDDKQVYLVRGAVNTIHTSGSWVTYGYTVPLSYSNRTKKWYLEDESYLSFHKPKASWYN